jgi:hypothetical protein
MSRSHGVNPENERFIDEHPMLDAEPDLLDDRDVADIQQSLEQLRRGEVIDAADLHAEIRKRFAGT